MNADAMRYLIVSIYRGEEYMPDRRLSDLDRATTVRQIAAGEFETITHVIEFNIAEGIIADVTDDVLQEAAQKTRELRFK